MCFHRDHPFLNFTLNELVSQFNPLIWGQQGPKRVSECAKQYCVLEQGSEKLEGINCMPKDDKFETGGKFSILHHSSGIHKLLCSTKVMASFNFKKLFYNLVNIETNNCKKIYSWLWKTKHNLRTTYPLAGVGKVLRQRRWPFGQGGDQG